MKIPYHRTYYHKKKRRKHSRPQSVKMDCCERCPYTNEDERISSPTQLQSNQRHGLTCKNCDGKCFQDDMTGMPNLRRMAVMRN